MQILSAGIQLSAIWSVEAGQRVSPFTLAIIVVACRHCRCDLKDNESDARDKTILVETVKDREGGGAGMGENPSRRDCSRRSLCQPIGRRSGKIDRRLRLDANSGTNRATVNSVFFKVVSTTLLGIDRFSQVSKTKVSSFCTK